MKIHTKPGQSGYRGGREKGDLERVPAGEHNTWRIVIQEKRNGKARRTVDLSYLSKLGLDESHQTSSAQIIAKRVPGNKYKSTLDCFDGYHGIALAEEDRHKTTFATECSAKGEPPRDTYRLETATAGTQTLG